MGNTCLKNANNPLVSLNCVVVAKSNNVIVDRVDGEEIEQVEDKKKAVVALISSREKMNDEPAKYTDEDIERIVSLYNKFKNEKKNKDAKNVDIEIKKINAKYRNIPIFLSQELVYGIRINIFNDFIEFMDTLRDFFKRLLDIAKMNTDSDDDYVRFIFLNAPKTPFSTSSMKLKDFTVDQFLDTFERMMNSGKTIIADGWETLVTIQITHSQDKNIMRKKKIKKKNKIYHFLNKTKDAGGGVNFPKKNNRSIRQGVFQVICSSFNKMISNCCFVVALLIALCFYKKEVKVREKKIEEILSIEEIKDVYNECKLKIGVKINGYDYDTIYEKYLKKRGIDLVIYSDQCYNNIVYDSRVDEEGNLLRFTNDVIVLWINNNHYDVITNMGMFTKTNISCFKCMKRYTPYEFASNHVCKTNLSCKKCFSSMIKCQKETFIKCTQCNIFFDNRECFQNHLTQRIFFDSKHKNTKLTPCQCFFYCDTCQKITPRFFNLKKDKVVNHNCQKKMCHRCIKYEKNHQCYMKPMKEVKNSAFPKIFFYDFETKEVDGKIVPFYCVVQKVCVECDQIEFIAKKKYFEKGTEDFSDKSIEQVECCGYRQYVFENNGENVIRDFIDFVLKNENSTWIAHNGSRFDVIFVLNSILIDRDITPDLIMNGNKVMMLKIPFVDIKFIDSYLFIDTRLANFPLTLGFSDLTKGFHPYLFYDVNYVGSMIEKKFFDLEKIEISGKNEEFEKWYNEKCEKEYVFRNEIYYYCCMDVEILRKGCIKFAYLLRETTRVFPFYDNDCITIAGVALKVFKLNFLNKHTLSLLPEEGYRGNINQSIIALSWLIKINEINPIEYRLSHGERKILGRYVDGYCQNTNTVYQFHGCFFHGCKKCFDLECYNVLLKETFYVLHERTVRFTKLLRSSGYIVIEKWECDYINETGITKTKLNEMKMTYFKYLSINPRDALYGGRTSAACLYYEVKENEKIRYLDFTSLYPYVQKKQKFPTGHPKIYAQEECNNIDIESVTGLIKCIILPPQNLFFPVLPIRVNGKLIFSLCYTCSIKKDKICDHSEEERYLLGTWTSIEVQKAIEKGYRIIEVVEIYDYERKEKIFGKYVNTFLKMKQESSGIPKTCLNDSDLECFIKDFEKIENVKLDKNNIIKNSALRTIAKKLLNSLWGKLAQNDNNVTVDFINNYNDLITLLNDNTVEVTTTDYISDNIARITYKKTDSTTSYQNNRNVIIASFVTAYARLELFALLDKLKERVLYYDTDSVFYIEKKHSEKIKTGNFLGDLTDELEKDNCSEIWIEHFCSTGPKCYSYITNEYVHTDPKSGETKKKINETTNVKGFAKTRESIEKLNFLSLKRCVTDNDQKIIIEYKKRFVRKNEQQILLQNEKKTFSFTFDKRVVNDDFTTCPFGFFNYLD